jgi:hypothetical protein
MIDSKGSPPSEVRGPRDKGVHDRRGPRLNPTTEVSGRQNGTVPPEEPVGDSIGRPVHIGSVPHGRPTR